METYICFSEDVLKIHQVCVAFSSYQDQAKTTISTRFSKLWWICRIIFTFQTQASSRILFDHSGLIFANLPGLFAPVFHELPFQEEGGTKIWRYNRVLSFYQGWGGPAVQYRQYTPVPANFGLVSDWRSNLGCSVLDWECQSLHLGNDPVHPDCRSFYFPALYFADLTIKVALRAKI